MSIKVYAKEDCIYCKKLDILLAEYNIKHTKQYLSTTKQIVDLKNISKMNTFPMVFIGPECIGGYTEFLNLLMTNSFEEKLKAHNINDINIPSLF